jgi:hypothetical protein
MSDSKSDSLSSSATWRINHHETHDAAALAHKANAVLTNPLGAAQNRFRVDASGIHRSINEDWVWISGNVIVEAHVRTLNNDGWGKLLRFSDRDGKEKTWVMPRDNVIRRGHRPLQGAG